jgi:hypothetical protein
MSENNKPDMDLLALAGVTKAGLRDIDGTSVGGTPHADKINLRQMAGMEKPRQTTGNRPNLINNMDFIEMPKSRPMGQVDMDGMNLPDMPQERPVDFAPIPEGLQEHVQSQFENLQDDTPIRRVDKPAPVVTPSPEMDFDLFQFSMIKDMIKNLDISIVAMGGAMEELTSKRDMLMDLIKGEEKDD